VKQKDQKIGKLRGWLELVTPRLRAVPQIFLIFLIFLSISLQAQRRARRFAAKSFAHWRDRKVMLTPPRAA
jgi:hypothetical protein